MAKSDCSKEGSSWQKKLEKDRKIGSVSDNKWYYHGTLFIVITLYPVLNTLAISLNDGTDAPFAEEFICCQENSTWKNYITVLQKDNLITGAYITVARTIIGTLLALVANAILAFIVSRKRFLF